LKLRQHRKRRNTLVLRNARRCLFARSARLQLSSWFARFIDRQMATSYSQSRGYEQWPESHR